MILLSLFRVVVETLTVFLYLRAIYVQKGTRLRSLVLFILISLISTTSFLLGSIAINIIFTISTTVLLAITCFQCKATMAVFHSFVLVTLIGICEFIPYLLLMQFFPEAQPNDLYFLWLNALFSKLLFFVSGYGAGKLAAKRKLEVNTLRQFLPLSILPVATCVTMIGAYGLFLPTAHLNFTLLLIGVVLLLLANIVVLVFYDYSTQANRKLYQLELSKEKQVLDYHYFEALEKNYTESRILIHDIQNHLLAIQELVHTEDRARLQDYLSGLQNNPALSTRMILSENRILNAILTAKKDFCDDSGIAFEIRSEGLCLSGIDDIDLCALVSNLLDNAVEAAQTSVEKQVWLSLFVQNDAMNVLVFKNTCGTKPTSHGDRFISGKESSDRHGIGLISVEKVVIKYSGSVRYRYDEDERIFLATVLLPI